MTIDVANFISLSYRKILSIHIDGVLMFSRGKNVELLPIRKFENDDKWFDKSLLIMNGVIR